MKALAIRRWPWASLVIFGVIVVAVFLVPVSFPRGEDISVPKGDDPKPIGALTRQTTVTQQFPATGTAIRSIGLQFGTYRRVNPGVMSVSLLGYEGDRWRNLSTQRLATETLVDNEFTTIAFNPPIAVSLDQLLRLTVQTEADQEHAVTWWVNPAYQAAGYSLSVNGKPEPGTARFEVSFARQQGTLATVHNSVVARVGVLLSSPQRTVLIAATIILLVGISFLGRCLPDAPDDSAVDSATTRTILPAVEMSGARVPRAEQEEQG